MSYTLDLYFEPTVPYHRMLQYFAERKNFTVAKDDVGYRNADTGVYFSFALRCKRNFLLQKKVTSAEFEINYYRPSFFGIEGERELSAFVAAFQPRIEDPQMRGMEDGPYSGEGFLKGWNFGNLFSVRSILADKPDLTFASIPAEMLRAVWTWNDHRGERSDKMGERCFVPMIMFFRIDGRASRVAAWRVGHQFCCRESILSSSNDLVRAVPASASRPGPKFATLHSVPASTPLRIRSTSPFSRRQSQSRTGSMRRL
jgi:hypothetical protein